MQNGPINSAKLIGLFAVVMSLGLAVGLVVVANSASFGTAIAALTALVVSVAAFYSIETGLMALIFVACTDGFLKGISPGWHTQLLKDYLLAICLLRWAWLSAIGHRRESVHQPVAIPMALFIMWCSMQMFNTTTHNFMLAIAGLRGWVVWFAVFFVAYDDITSREKLERFLRYLTFLLVPIALYTVLQYNIGYDHLYRLGPGFRSYLKAGYYAEDSHIELRPAATMISPHNNAAAMSCGLLVAAGAVLFLRRRRYLQIAAISALPLQGIALMLTAARAAFASTSIAVFVLLMLVRRTGLAIILALVVGIAFTQVGRITSGAAVDRMTSVATRAEYSLWRTWTPWLVAVAHARTHPLGSGVATGHAAGRIIDNQLRGQRGQTEDIPWAENEFGRALIELGVPGLFLFLWMLYAVVKAMHRSFAGMQTAEYRWLAAGLLSACVGVITRLAVGASLYTWPEGILFWVFAAICLRLPQMEADELELANEAGQLDQAEARR